MDREEDRSDRRADREPGPPPIDDVVAPRSGGGRLDPMVRAAVQRAVVPRLAMFGSVEPGDGAAAPGALHPDGIERFARLCIGAAPDAPLARLRAEQAAGLSLETLCLDLIAPAARRMGELWCEDRCDFVDVTLGGLRLVTAVRALASRARAPTAPPRRRGAAVIAAAPGETHILGATILAALFERAGWRVIGGGALSGAEIRAAVARESVDVLALSLSRSDLMNRLGAVIASARRASANRRLGVMVGGPAFASDANAAARVGADASAADARHAVRRAARLMDLATIMR